MSVWSGPFNVRTRHSVAKILKVLTNASVKKDFIGLTILAKVKPHVYNLIKQDNINMQ